MNNKEKKHVTAIAIGLAIYAVVSSISTLWLVTDCMLMCLGM